jgi:hypothetical protein
VDTDFPCGWWWWILDRFGMGFSCAGDRGGAVRCSGVSGWVEFLMARASLACECEDVKYFQGENDYHCVCC